MSGILKSLEQDVGKGETERQRLKSLKFWNTEQFLMDEDLIWLNSSQFKNLASGVSVLYKWATHIPNFMNCKLYRLLQINCGEKSRTKFAKKFLI